MTTPTDDDRDLLTVVAYMTAAEGREDELREELRALVEPTVQEDGCVNYDLHESTGSPGTFVFYENWASAEHLDAHLSAPHMEAILPKTGELLDEGGLTILRLRRIA